MGATMARRRMKAAKQKKLLLQQSQASKPAEPSPEKHQKVKKAK